jgi:hypothetical protein
MRPMLDSIVAQTRKPDRIVLWLPNFCLKENTGYAIPEGMVGWMAAHGMEICSCNRDWGPATKLIPTLLSEKDGDTAIITFDDDLAYECHAVEELVTASEKWPDDSLGFMGGANLGSSILFIHAEMVSAHGVERQYIEMLGGYRGILYRRKMFDGSVIDELNELLKEGPFVVDDQLFGWNLKRRGINRFVIRTNYPDPVKVLNFNFLHLNNSIYEGEQNLANESLRRLEALYTRRGWTP